MDLEITVFDYYIFYIKLQVNAGDVAFLIILLLNSSIFFYFEFELFFVKRNNKDKDIYLK